MVVTGATGYFLDVSTHSDFSDYLTGYNNLDVGNVLEKTVTGLTANTTYYYRVRAKNASGSGLSSSTITVVIPEAVEDLTIDLGQPTNITSTTYKLGNFAISGSAEIKSISVSVDNGTLSMATNSAYSLYYDLNNKYVSVVFNTKVSASIAANAIKSGLTFTVPSTGTQKVTFSVDGNDTSLPAGTKMTSFAHPDGTIHYYTYIEDYHQSWTASYNAAKSYIYQGMTGYLVTITSQAEDKVLDGITLKGGWSGGSRYNKNTVWDPATANFIAASARSNDKFIWACGPEAGTAYYNYTTPAASTGGKGAIAGVYQHFANFNEPNNHNGSANSSYDVGPYEWCMQVHFASEKGWNDLPDSPDADDTLDGYFVEFSSYSTGTGTVGVASKSASGEFSINKKQMNSIETEKSTIPSTDVVINNGTFTATWSAVEGAVYYNLQVATSSDFSTGILAGYNPKNVGNVLSHVVTITDSTCKYYYRVTPVNYIDEGEKSNTKEVKLEAAPAPSFNESDVITSKTDDKITINTVTGYDYKLIKVATPEVTVEDWFTGNGSTHDFPNLDDNTAYKVLLRVTPNEGDVDPNTQTIQITTKEEGPAAPVIVPTETIANKTNNSFTISTVVSYEYRLIIKGTPETVVENWFDGDGNTHTFNDLAPNATYTVQV